MLNISFAGFLQDEGASPLDGAYYQAYFRKVNAGSSDPAWNTVRQTGADGYWAINLGDGDFLSQDGLADDGDEVVVAAWVGTDNVRTSVNKTALIFFVFTLAGGAAVYTQTITVYLNAGPTMSFNYSTDPIVRGDFVSFTNACTVGTSFGGGMEQQAEYQGVSIFPIGIAGGTLNFDDGAFYDFVAGENVAHQYNTTGNVTPYGSVDDLLGANDAWTGATIEVHYGPPVPGLTWPSPIIPGIAHDFTPDITDPDGRVTSVDYWVNGVQEATGYTAVQLFSWTFSESNRGPNTITQVVHYNDGFSSLTVQDDFEAEVVADVATILAGERILNLRWLFEITRPDATVHRISNTTTTAYTYNWEGRVREFSGLTLRYNPTGGVYAPSTLNFAMEKMGDALSPEDFRGSEIHLRIVCEDPYDPLYTQTLRSWRFIIEKVSEAYDLMRFSATDLLTYYLKGDFPNTPLVSTLYPYSTVPQNMCVPVTFGTAYIPLCPLINESGNVAYMLGRGNKNYTVTRVRSPREIGPKVEWTSASYSFLQDTIAHAFDGLTYKHLRPVIARSTPTGAVDSVGVFTNGEGMLPMPALFTHDGDYDSNPAVAIKQILLEFGIPSARLNHTSWTTRETEFDAEGLVFNGGFYYKEPREKVLARLLAHVDCYIVPGDVYELHRFSMTPAATVTPAEVEMLNGENFKYSPIVNETLETAGYVSWQKVGESQDATYKSILTAEASLAQQSTQEIQVPYFTDAASVSKSARLQLQRMFYKRGTATFRGLYSLLLLSPGNTVSIEDANYGWDGAFVGVVESLKIGADLSLDFQCGHYYSETNSPVDDWSSVASAAITFLTDLPQNSWSPVLQGPGSGETINPNRILGPLEMTDGPNRIIFDPASMVIDMVGADAGRLTLDGFNKIITAIDANGTKAYLSEGIWNVGTPDGGGTVDNEYPSRIAFGNAASGDVIPLDPPFRNFPKVFLAISSLRTYDAASKNQNQAWRVFAENVSESGFTVHSLLTREGVPTDVNVSRYMYTAPAEYVGNSVADTTAFDIHVRVNPYYIYYDDENWPMGYDRYQITYRLSYKRTVDSAYNLLGTWTRTAGTPTTPPWSWTTYVHTKSGLAPDNYNLRVELLSMTLLSSGKPGWWWSTDPAGLLYLKHVDYANQEDLDTDGEVLYIAVDGG